MFNKQLFILAHQVGDRSFYPTYQYLLKNQWRPYAELKEEQEKHLRHMISFVYENVPYYNKLFHQLKLRPDNIRKISDLERLPILTKDIIKQHWEEFKPIDLKKIKYNENMTGGSTGTPFLYRLSRQDRFCSGAHLYRGWGYGGYELGDRMIVLAGSSLSVGTKSVASKKLHEIVMNNHMLSSFDMGEREMRKYANIINNFQPLFIRGYASSIYFFAKWADENDIRIVQPKCVFTTAEKLYPHMREKISSVFQCDVLDGYGLNDGGISANECMAHTGLHIDTERGILEVVDDSGNQVGNGEGRILATSLNNTAMSFLRYDTGDLGFLLPDDEVCSCGRGSRLLREIIGRSADILVTPDGKHVHGWYMGMLVTEFWKDQIKEFQVVQETITNVVIYVVPEPHFDERVLETLRQKIIERGFGWYLELRVVDAINKTRAGKYRWVINNISR